jgi:hypothetical protein
VMLPAGVSGTLIANGQQRPISGAISF